MENMESSCIFCKIVAGEIPASKVYEDDEILIFSDIHPLTKIHLLCVPKEHFRVLAEVTPKRAALLGRTMQKIGKIAEDLGLGEGYRVVINQGENAGQTVPHLHLHLLGGEPLGWEK